MAPLSARLQMIVDALPLRPGMRVLEIGCGPGAAARAVAERIQPGFVLAIDRSAKAIDAAIAASSAVARTRLRFRQVAAEDFRLEDGEESFDLAFAVRVGAFDGRHPESGRKAKARLKEALKPDGALYIDGGDPLRRIDLDA
jgi:SAM-dependent methyltransferase